MEVLTQETSKSRVRCGVIKDAGDDPDITDGMMVCACVSRRMDKDIVIDGGAGVGRVTLPGLDQPVGVAAINSVPRQMITASVREAASEAGADCGFDVVIDIPGGEQAAEKTLNASLGIMGGLSVLGTTGIVHPMSEQALIDTIALEISQRRALGDRILYMVPGNYGETFLKEHHPDAAARVVRISNYIGESLDLAMESGAEGVMLTGHIGKLIKVAGGIMNTHSRFADARMEIMAAAAATTGADAALIREILAAKTTDAGLALISDAGLTEKVMTYLVGRMEEYIARRTGGEIPVGIMVFSNVYGLLGKNKAADRMLDVEAFSGPGEV